MAHCGGLIYAFFFLQKHETLTLSICYFFFFIHYLTFLLLLILSCEIFKHRNPNLSYPFLNEF